MSSRPVSPPPIARWPFIAGDILLLAICWFVLAQVERPLPVVPLVVAVVCASLGVVLLVTPFILEYSQRLQLAEAAVREGAEVQVRRLAQTADQLAHVVSRGQSTEEQAGRALGTLEEVAERMVGQAEEMAAALGRTGEREQAARAAEIQHLLEERDGKLAAVEARLQAVVGELEELKASVRKGTGAAARGIEGVGSRLDSVVAELRQVIAARPTPEPVEVPTTVAAAVDAVPVERGSGSFENNHPTAHHPVEEARIGATPAAVVETPTEKSPAVGVKEGGDVATEAPAAAPRMRKRTTAISRSEERTVEAVGGEAGALGKESVEEKLAVEEVQVAPVIPSAPAPLELALEGMPEPRPPMRLNRKEPAGSTSLVATAYIGIGNKLYVRGEGPGLSWERGVPMQFLAIGKWGWTTTDATAPVTCRVYRNDDTPMLEENIVIDPGAKAEVTPKF